MNRQIVIVTSYNLSTPILDKKYFIIFLSNPDSIPPNLDNANKLS